MLKQLLILMLLLCGSTAHAQSGGTGWAPPGASWTYTFRYFTEYGDVRVSYARDTVINGRTCQIIKQQVLSQSLQFPAFGIQIYSYPSLITAADANKVYLYANNQFFTLYDFAAQPGASWLLLASAPLGRFCTEPVRAIVDSAGQRQFAGQLRRWIRVRLEVVGAPQSRVTGMSGRIYEGIGPVEGYLTPQGSYNQCGGGSDPIEAGALLCFRATGTSPVFNGPTQACTLLSTAEQRANEVGFTVFPNPSAGELTLELPARLGAAQLSIHDLTGRCVWRGPIPASRRLDLQALPRGLYAATLQEAGQAVATRRFVLE